MALRIGFAVLALALIVLQLVSEWGDVRRSMSELGPWPVVHSFAWACAGLLLSSLAWRECVAGVSRRLPMRPAQRMFFLSQTGKYIPGAVWTFVAQMEMGRRYDIPRARGAVAQLLFMVLHLATGLVIAALALPFSGDLAGSWYAWLTLLALPLAALLHPAVLTRALNLLFRLIRRPPLEERLPWRMIWRSVAALVPMWLAYGASVAAYTTVLGHGVDMSTLMLSLGGYALAWSAGIMVMVFPAGLGVREAVLVLALGPALGVGAATAVAALVRVTHTAGDLVLALVFGALRRSGDTMPAVEPPVEAAPLGRSGP